MTKKNQICEHIITTSNLFQISWNLGRLQNMEESAKSRTVSKWCNPQEELQKFKQDIRKRISKLTPWEKVELNQQAEEDVTHRARLDKLFDS